MIKSAQMELLLSELDCVSTEIWELTEEMNDIKIETDIRGCLVFKYIRCGKMGCRCTSGIDLHGPYPHLQTWEKGKIKTKYLNRMVYPKYKREIDKIKRRKELIKIIHGLEKRKAKIENRVNLLNNDC